MNDDLLDEDLADDVVRRRMGWHQVGFYERDVSWHVDALCAEVEPDLWFPEKGGSTKEAKRICGDCLVQAECLTYALDIGERFGIWGAKSERERHRLTKALAAIGDAA